jgi:hypothetical protein
VSATEVDPVIEGAHELDSFLPLMIFGLNPNKFLDSEFVFADT